ncbi:hypothetical protein U716_03325 [Rhodobacter capsulatus B6]|nr:hypothetical protein U716_03325 [Rhodobacter capsulatus B6]
MSLSIDASVVTGVISDDIAPQTTRAMAGRLLMLS